MQRIQPADAMAARNPSAAHHRVIIAHLHGPFRLPQAPWPGQAYARMGPDLLTVLGASLLRCGYP